MKRSAQGLVAIGLIGAALLAAAPSCEGEEDCAVEQENCSADYLDENGLTGCCDGLTCGTSINGYLVCQ